MLSVYRLQRLFDSRRYEAILAGLESNGMILPLPLRVRLAESPVAAVALGLRRLLELTYGPTGLSRDMLGFVLAAQADDGSFAADPLATAAAAAVLQRARRDRHPASPSSPIEPSRTCRQAVAVDRALDRACELALTALAAMQDGDGLFHAQADRTHSQRVLTAAFVAYLLSADETFCRTVRFADLMTTLEETHDAVDTDTQTLIDLARLQTPDDALIDNPALTLAA